MPQLNETLLDLFLINGIMFIYFNDLLIQIEELDDELLIYNNVILLIKNHVKVL